ncbi:2'-5' RNA ligase family protein [Microbacterium sp. EST19A]|uniref:2'-5' RNA ligase family protein n=1 Tax=Microbacterium sp. EST19A TaxID=2862681 RepID=UPI001CBBBACB|nr:2'-5' RNA ligase family protein [Microbacterium sp. EST19A]
MDDPAQLASLEGQQYLVLRPTIAVASLYREVQDAALARLGGDIPHPRTEHVTLRAFSEPDRRTEVGALVRDWAARQHPIEVTAEAVDVFPAPWQILIVRIARSAALVSAYADLSAALESTDFRRLDERGVEDWTFHLSVVYGRTLDPAAWQEFADASRTELSLQPAETIAEAELVWYEDGEEHAEVIPLGP